jgi:hypothetical protein
MDSCKTQAKVTVVLLATTVVILLPQTPLITPVPFRDPGFFLYMGQQILDGKLPYRDVWDHKPPAIYYIDALGLLLGRGSGWGVWFLEVVSLWCTAQLGLHMMRRTFGSVPAALASLAWVVGLIPLLLEGGNMTEEFGLPFQFAALYLFAQTEWKEDWSWQSFVIGVAGAVAFFLKQPLIGIWLAIGIYLLVTRSLANQWRSLALRLIMIAFGVISVVVSVVSYFAANHALASFVDAVFRYNVVYAATTLRERVDTLISGLRLTSISGIAIMALLGWMVGVDWLRNTQRPDQKRILPLLGVALIDAPIELAFASVSGRPYVHYFIPWLPSFAILTGFFIYAVSSEPEARSSAAFARLRLNTTMITRLFFAMSFAPAGLLIVHLALAKNYDTAREETAAYLSRMTRPADYVLMWGATTGVNFVAHRSSPTRFAYQYPLYTRGYQTTSMIDAFFRDIMAHPPALIIDASTERGNGVIPPIDPAKRQQWVSSNPSYAPLPAMDRVFDYVSSNYRFIGTTGHDQWPVYMYRAPRG